MKLLAGILGALILLIQYPLWLGKGGWLRAWDMNRQVEAQRAKNRQLEVRNATLGAEVRDLKQGTEAIEERARRELGMIRNDEIFFQIVEPKSGENRGQSPISGDAQLRK
jgi:cell division protein FtsB